MSLDSELKSLWQSEPMPEHLVKTMRRVQSYRRWWIVQRVIEAAATIYVAAHYISHRGSEVGHWLYLPIALVLFPALWILIYKNAHTARVHVSLEANAFLALRMQQIHAALREVRFTMFSAIGLLAYALSAWWVMRVVAASAEAQKAAEGLLVLTVMGAVLLFAIGAWRRKHYELELAIHRQTSSELDDRSTQ